MIPELVEGQCGHIVSAFIVENLLLMNAVDENPTMLSFNEKGLCGYVPTTGDPAFNAG